MQPLDVLRLVGVSCLVKVTSFSHLSLNACFCLNYTCILCFYMYEGCSK